MKEAESDDELMCNACIWIVLARHFNAEKQRMDCLKCTGIEVGTEGKLGEPSELK